MTSPCYSSPGAGGRPVPIPVANGTVTMGNVARAVASARQANNMNERARATLRIPSLLAASILSLLLVFFFAEGQARAADVEGAWLDAPEGTVAVWIDVEGSDLTAVQISGTLNNGATKIPLSFVISPAGLTATVENDSSRVALELLSTKEAEARIAVTFVAQDGTILADTNAVVALPVDQAENVTPAPVPPAGDTDKGGGVTGGSSVLATTGAFVGGFLILALVLVSIGALFVNQRGKALSK